MLAESERLFAETGSYAGLTGELALKDSRADRVREALLAAARRSGLGARDGAQHLRLADRPRARRALLRALHARGRLDRALDRDHRPRPHDVGRDQVHGPQGLGGQPADPTRATSSPTTTRRSATSTTPTCRPSSRSSTSPTPTVPSWSPGPAGSPTCSTSAPRRRAASRSARPTASTTASTSPA